MGLEMSGKTQLYRSYINKQMFYAHSTKPLTALRKIRRQAVLKYGRYTITDLYVREEMEGMKKWVKIQLTTELLLQSCGHS